MIGRKQRKPERPWVKVPANEVPKGARLWTADEGPPYPTFVRVERKRSDTQFRRDSWDLVFIGAMTGMELRMGLESRTDLIKVFREDVNDRKG